MSAAVEAATPSAAERPWPLPWLVTLRWTAAICAVVLLGGALRFHGLDWDRPSGADTPLQMHPDERFLSLVSGRIAWSGADGYFNSPKSTLNPYNDPETHSYVYGTFPLFLAKGVSALAGDDEYSTTVIWGRRITALTDTLTIALVFGLGSVLFGKRIGLLGSLFYALAVLPTQLAHFWTMDPYVTFFATATLLLSALLIRDRGRLATTSLYSAIGLTIGLGLASKVTAWPLALGPIATVAIRAGMREFPQLALRWRGRRFQPAGQWITDLSWLCYAAVISLIVFRIAQPYAFAGPHIWDMGFSQRWLDDIRREIDFQNGNVDYPPFVQFAGDTPFLTSWKTMVLWGMGPALGIASWLAIAAAAVVLFRRRETAFVLPMVFVAGVFGFQGPRFVAFMRYFAPIYPALCLFAAWGLFELANVIGRDRVWQRLKLRRPIPLVVSFAALGLVVACSTWWAIAFQAVYRQEHPRITASRWIYANVPEGSFLTTELWDDSLPYAIPDAPLGLYGQVATEPYTTDSVDKVHKLIYGDSNDPAHLGLIKADYVIVSSNRIRDSVKKLEREYPATNRYYQLLDSGGLGFERVARFSSHPTFLGLSIDDSTAEESFTVYDHPEVRIYKKTATWDPAKAEAMLLEAHPERAVNLLPRQGGTNGLQFTAAKAATQQAGGTFSTVFSANGFFSHAPWLWWLVFIELLSFASLPWLTWVFGAMPDRGLGLAKLAGLISVVVPTWLIVAWGGSEFNAALVWAVYAAMLTAGAGLALIRRQSLWAELRAHWRTLVAVEAVFLIAFAAFLALRLFNPDLWYHPQGGEKPMELAYLTAVTRSSILPPYDPWFAGGTMNYYYMGWFFLAVPIRALHLLPEVAFNLAIPTYAALSSTVAFSTVYNLVALSKRARERTTTIPSRRFATPLAAATLGSILLIAMGNLDAGHQTIEHLQAVNHWGLFEGVPVLGGAVGIAGGLKSWLIDGALLPPFDWWRSSRVHFGQFDITEFPYWSLLFADLHPHLMGVPFFGLTIAGGVAYATTARSGRRRPAAALAALLGLALGLVRTVHTWDFPTAILIALTALAIGAWFAPGRWQQRWWDGVLHLALVGGVLLVPFAPFTAHFESFDAGIMRAPETTQPQQYFDHFGLFVTLAVGFLIVRYREVLQLRPIGRNVALASVAGPLECLALVVFAAGLTAFSVQWGLAVIALSILIEVYLLNLLWLEWRAPDTDLARLLVTALYVLAFGIAAGVDVVTLNGDIVRMNTVFKFSLQAWHLFALASAYTTWYVGKELWNIAGWRTAPKPRTALVTWPATALVAVLLFAGVLYLIEGTPARQNARFASSGPTLNGLAYMENARYVEDLGTADPADDHLILLKDDTPLIHWLRDNVQGSPVIAEAIGPLYHWTGRISENTGLPAVIGWDWHQIQQRTDYTQLIQERRAATDDFYRDRSPTLANLYLLKYNVSYVIVGSEEIAHGTPDGIAKFEKMDSLTAVYQSGDFRIYRVNKDRLSPQPEVQGPVQEQAQPTPPAPTPASPTPAAPTPQPPEPESTAGPQ